MVIDHIKKIAHKAEQTLNTLFASPADVHVCDHIYVADRPESQALAETLVEHLPDNLFISIRVSPRLIELYDGKESPLVALRQDNLGLLSIISEEVSHFQLICQAALHDTPTSHWDLELQSEFDKFMIAAYILNHQTGRPHLHHLARLLFDTTRVYDQNIVYEKTGAIAAHWWWTQINRDGDSLFTKPEFVRSIKEMRSLQGEAKLRYITKTSTNLLGRSA